MQSAPAFKSQISAIVAVMKRSQRTALGEHPITSQMIQIIALAAASLLACGGAFGQANSSAGKAAPPAAQSLPQDRHEGLSVSVDPYTDMARAKDRFGKANPVPLGILPVEVFLHNETAQPIRVNEIGRASCRERV